MQRHEADDPFLYACAELLDEAVRERGLTNGGFLVLRELRRSERDGGPASVARLVDRLGAGASEIESFVVRLERRGLIAPAGRSAAPDQNRYGVTDAGAEILSAVDGVIRDNAERLALEHPGETTTVGAIAIAMRAGRFGSDELIDLLASA